MRIGVFGGTFDPPHIGHLLSASDAYEALTLDRLLFVPAGMQPFKVGAVHATSRQRLEMLALLVNADQRFAVDPIEIEREGLSFTVDTLATLADREAGAALFLLVGQDLAGQIGTWREPARIAELAEIVVLSRPGCEPAASMSGAVTLPMRRLQTRRIEISSSEIRERVRTGKSIHGFVPDAVADYIESAGLYR